MPEFILDDGGRAAAGYRGKGRDCACRAVAIATGRPYATVYSELAEINAHMPLSKHRRNTPSAAPPTATAFSPRAGCSRTT